MKCTRLGQTARSLRWIGCVAGACAATAIASPPREPIPIPAFSFDLGSPSVSTGGTGVSADSVLVQGAVPDGQPATLIAGQNLGLGRAGDELDDITYSRADVPAAQAFTLIFSVSRSTTAGGFPPDAAQLAAQTPFTVSDQSIRGHAAGDAFMSFNTFNRNGIISLLRLLPPGSNTQVVNNYDEGGHDFQAQPPTSARDYSAAPQDNVDSVASQPAGPTPRTLPPLFYTVSSQSPSLRNGFLPGTSGADIFIKLQPTNPTPPPQLFASAAQLGLSSMPPNDNDIDALVVIDDNANNVFDAGDLVLFSLKPGSPALALIPGHSQNAAADILAVQGLAGGTPAPFVFAQSIDIGLAGAGDDVDGVEIFACNAGANCALNAGIRFIKGDKDNDGDVDLPDYSGFAMCLSGPKEGVGFVFPSLECREVYDFNRDNDVDLHDFMGFQLAFGTPP